MRVIKLIWKTVMAIGYLGYVAVMILSFDEDHEF